MQKLSLIVIKTLVSQKIFATMTFESGKYFLHYYQKCCHTDEYVALQYFYALVDIVKIYIL